MLKSVLVSVRIIIRLLRDGIVHASRRGNPHSRFVNLQSCSRALCGLLKVGVARRCRKIMSRAPAVKLWSRCPPGSATRTCPKFFSFFTFHLSQKKNVDRVVESSIAGQRDYLELFSISLPHVYVFVRLLNILCREGS